MYYVHKDHLGSLDKVTNSAGSVIQRTSFDAWGRRRNPDNWTYSNIPTTTFSRGYTGHEHLDQFDLINMNGRMYDPILGRFLSADNFVQNPFGSQSYNRYSYVSNNPLAFSDPSGYLLQGVNFWSLVDDLWNRAGKNGGAGWSESGGLWSSDFSEYGIFTGYSSNEVPIYSVSATGGSPILKERGLKLQKVQWGHPRLPKFSVNYLGAKTVWYPNYSFGGFGAQSNKGAQGGGGDINGTGVLRTTSDVASYAPAAIGLTQIGMIQYRNTLSIHSKVGSFGKFSSTYIGLDKFSGRVGTAGALVGVGFNINDFSTGEIGTGRFVYRTGSIGASMITGAAIGGPWGALGGAAVDVTATGFEYIYDSFLVPLGNEIQYQIWNFENAISNGWYPGR